MLNVSIELIDQGGDRQRCAHVVGGLDHDTQIFAHPVDCEAKVELTIDHSGVSIFHLPALCGAFRDGGNHCTAIQPRFVGKVQCF